MPLGVFKAATRFSVGSGSLYNGTELVARSVARVRKFLASFLNPSIILSLKGTPIIYVNINYRLGPLGFPQGLEAANKDALNLGLQDGLAALEWIQQNIGVFGGDKTKVSKIPNSSLWFVLTFGIQVCHATRNGPLT